MEITHKGDKVIDLTPSIKQKALRKKLLGSFLELVALLAP